MADTAQAPHPSQAWLNAAAAKRAALWASLLLALLRSEAGLRARQQSRKTVVASPRMSGLQKAGARGHHDLFPLIRRKGGLKRWLSHGVAGLSDPICRWERKHQRLEVSNPQPTRPKHWLSSSNSETIKPNPLFLQWMPLPGPKALKPI